MPPRILLVSQAPKKYKLYVNTLPPIGILGIAAYLEKNNIPVDVVDCNVEPEKKIDSSNYDIVGYSINIANITSSLESIRYLEKGATSLKDSLKLVYSFFVPWITSSLDLY